jgi:hypothetical protein
MKEVNYDYGKWSLVIRVPEEIELFMKAAHIDEKEVFDRGMWGDLVEDTIFFSHEKHPTEPGYAPFGVGPCFEPLSKSTKITALIYGFYLSSSKIFILNLNELEKAKPLVTSSTSIKGGWRMYIAYYDNL